MAQEPVPAAPMPFFAYVGEDERVIWRVAVWSLAGLLLAIAGLAAVGLAFVALAPDQYAVMQDSADAFSGKDGLYLEAVSVALLVAMTALGAGGFLGAARYVFRRPAWTFVSPARPFSLILTATGLGVGGVLFAAQVAFEVLALGQKLAPPIFSRAYDVVQRTAYGVSGAPFMLLIAASEEILFRGVLLQIMGAFTRNRWGLCLLNGALFSLVHGDTAPAAFAGHMVIGSVWAWSVLELGGLEFAVGAHFVRNFLILLFVEPASAAARASSSYDWIDLSTDVVTGLVTVGAIQLISWWRRKRQAPS